MLLLLAARARDGHPRGVDGVVQHPRHKTDQQTLIKKRRLSHGCFFGQQGFLGGRAHIGKGQGVRGKTNYKSGKEVRKTSRKTIQNTVLNMVCEKLAKHLKPL